MGLNHSMQLIMSGVLNITQVSDLVCALRRLLKSVLACRRKHKSMDHGSIRTPPAPALGQLWHDYSSCDHCDLGWKVLIQLAWT